MGLKINTTWAKLAMNTTRGQMKIQQPRGEQTIKQTKPQVKIKSEKPKVIIDQYQCFAEAGLKNFLDLTREQINLARQAALEGIGRRAQDGDRMAMIQKNMPPAIPEIAEKNAWDDELDYNVDLMPKSRPKIQVKGDLKIDWVLGKAEINYTPKKPKTNYQRGKVEIYLKQKGSIDIQYVDVKA
ncbi:DUF6470 family protein [Thermohalobacter berrensis]|uniref:Uncharacterized protein n=1 Tax=Thermohalobacter berrensis TaxID=99594 RepID=A0A419T4H1_9FIRM|nr:DUF6470 family protein [Thermohalobacter berrensis]RKD32333.1 hypothetical protein BET03_03220 [Thermohalobacter berrensis]